MEFVQEVALLLQNNPIEATERCERFFSNQKLVRQWLKELEKAPAEERLKPFKVLTQVLYQCGSRSTSQLLLGVYEETLRHYAPVTSMCNNLSLAYISLQAQHYLRFNYPLETVEESLQQALSYLKPDIECDLFLLALQLNNLAVVLMHRQQFEKAFKTLLPLAGPLEIQIKKMKIQHRADLPEKMVVLVNCYLILASSLKKHLDQSKHLLNEALIDQYTDTIGNCYERGMELSLKYLGKKSLFSRLFRKIGADQRLTDRLPMVIKLPKNSREEQAKLLHRLESAVNTCINQRFEEIHGLLMSKTQDQVPPGTTLLYETMTRVDDARSMMARLYQNDQGHYSRVKLSLQKNGKTVFRSEISEEVVKSMQSESEWFMSLPFEVQFDSCNPYEFLQYFIVPHVKVSVDNKLQFCTLPLGLLDSLTIDFLGEPTTIIATHTKGCLYRICLHAEVTGYMIVVLQIGNCKSTEQVVTEFVEEGEAVLTRPEVCEVQEMKRCLSGKLEPTLKKKYFVPVKQLVNPTEFRKTVIAATQQLAEFLKTTLLPTFTKQEIFVSERFMFKFHLQKFGEPQSSISALRFDPVVGWEVIIHNNFQTMGPQQQPIYAKGTGLFSLQDFEDEFGLKYSQIKNKHHRLQVYHILLCMFTLKVYNKPLTNIEARLYSENASVRRRLINRVFRRTYLRRQFYIPVTACLVGFDGEEPLGIKLSFYSVGQNKESGAFLTIDPERWRRAKKKGAVASKFPPEKLKRLDRFKYKTQYDMISQFNLADVLQQGGFDVLLQNFQEDQDQQNSFSLNNGTAQVKWERLEVMLTFEKLKKRIEQEL